MTPSPAEWLLVFAVTLGLLLVLAWVTIREGRGMIERKYDSVACEARYDCHWERP